MVNGFDINQKDNFFTNFIHLQKQIVLKMKTSLDIAMRQH